MIMSSVRALPKVLNRWTRRRLLAFARSKSGIAATEFALIVPIMMAMYFGMIELTQALGHGRKSVILARSLSDMVTQSLGITDTDMNTIFNAAKTVMAPHTDDRLAMRVTSIMIDGAGTPYVEWSDVKNINAGLPLSPLGRCSIAGTDMVPAALRTPRSYLVVADVTLRHIPMFGSVLLPSGVDMKETMPMRPRVSQSISRQNIPNTPCPSAVP